MLREEGINGSETTDHIWLLECVISCCTLSLAVESSDISWNAFVDDSSTLKENLSDEIEYSLLPKTAWEKLVSWYGLQQGQVFFIKNAFFDVN